MTATMTMTPASPTTPRQSATTTRTRRHKSSRSSRSRTAPTPPPRPVTPVKVSADMTEEALLAFAMGAGYLLPASADLVSPPSSISMASTSSSRSRRSSISSSTRPSPPPSPCSSRRSSLKTCAGRLLLSVSLQPDNPENAATTQGDEQLTEVNFIMGERTVIPRHLLPTSLPSTPSLGCSYDPFSGPPTQQLFVNGYAMDIVVDEASKLKRVQPVLALAEFCKAAGATSRLDRDGEVKIDFA